MTIAFSTLAANPVLAAAGCPGTIQFDNSAGTGLWETPANWSTNVLPGPADDVCIPAGMAVQLNSGAQGIGTLFVASGAGLTIGGGSLSFGAPISQVDGSFTLTGGTLYPPGNGIGGLYDNLTVTGPFAWHGGSIVGPGTIKTYGAMTIGGDADKILYGELDTYGTVTWDAAGPIRLTGTAWIHNYGTWNLLNNAWINNTLGGVPRFTNHQGGLYRKSGGTGMSQTDIAFTNDGTVTVDSGTLSFGVAGPDVSEGTFNGSGAASTLRFSGNFTLGTASTVDVPNLEISALNLVLNGSVTVSGTTSVVVQYKATINASATIHSLGSSLIVNGTLLLSSGETFDVPSLTMTNSASLQGPDSFTVSGTFAWQGGSLSGAGTTTVNGTLALTSGGGTRNLKSGRILTVNGTTTQASFAGITAQAGTAIHNAGTWQGTPSFGGGGAFDNRPGASIVQTTGNGGIGGGPVTIDGAVSIQIGTFTMGGTSVTGAGSVTGLPGTRLILGGVYQQGVAINVPNVTVDTSSVDFSGSYNVTNSTSIVNGGSIVFRPAATIVSVGAVSISSGGTFSPGQSIDIPGLSLSGGTLYGPYGPGGAPAGAINVSGAVTWSGGEIAAGGPINANGGMAISGSVGKTLRRTLNLSGTTTWSGTTIGGTEGIVRNGGLFLAQSDAAWSGTLFDNLAGATFRKTTGTGTTELLVPFDNHGTTEITTGTLRLSSGGTNFGTLTGNPSTLLLVTGATCTMAAGSSTSMPNVEVDGGSLTVHGAWSTTESTTIKGGTLTLAPEAFVAGLGTDLTVQGGTLDLSGGEPIGVTNLIVAGGTLKGTDTLSAASLMYWTGGTLDGAGVIDADGGLSVSGTGNKDLSGGRILNTAGDSMWTGSGPVRIGSGASIRNAGTWTVLTNATLSDLGGGGLFDNLAGGTFARTSGSDVLNVTTGFANAGQVSVQTGILSFQGGYTQTAGGLSLEGGDVASGSPLNILGGSLTGVGTGTGNVSMAGGHLAPGLTQSPGVLTIDGALSDTGSAVFDVEIAGKTAGLADRAIVTGSAALDGTLHVTLLNGFVPTEADSYTIMTYASSAGTFAMLDAPHLPGRAWQMQYNPTSAVLQVVTDSDGDGIGNTTDCAPADADAWSQPVEVGKVTVAADGRTISWDSLAAQAGPGTTYDLVRGLVSQLPAGAGQAETCLAFDVSATLFDDPETPNIGEAFYYLVRAANVCGTGTYGSASDGTPRDTAVCP